MNNFKDLDVSQALVDNYLPFAGYVIQTRSLPDSRDGLKTGARHIIYSQHKAGITYNKEFKKGTATTAKAMEFNPHGDAAIYNNAVRLAKPFALRYPLLDAHGNYGSMVYGDDHAAGRYLELRGGKIAYEMVSLLSKDTIDSWRLNYSQDAKYPTVLPTRFPNILVNGNTGIGVGCASSVPQFNLREVIAALKLLVKKPNATFDEIYCPIDFATGGIVINESETKESLKYGKGKSAYVRAKIKYDEKERTLTVYELPYQVFTNTVAGQLEKGITEGYITGVESFFDGTDFSGVKIVIKLMKTALPEGVCAQLYKYTSLQSNFSINMMALENGKIPRIFSWEQLMKGYLAFLKEIVRKSYEHDKTVLENRVEILEGHIKALENIEEIIKIIKTSTSAPIASKQLQETYGFSSRQASAILELKLQRLVGLEKIAIEKELNEKATKLNDIVNILTVEERFNNVIINELDDIDKNYGDDRRTEVLDLEVEDDLLGEKKQLMLYQKANDSILLKESSMLITQRKGGKGVKVESDIINAIKCSTGDVICAFTSAGKMYRFNTKELPLDTEVKLSEQLGLMIDETIDFLTLEKLLKKQKYICFLTKKGLIKKTTSDGYICKRSSIAAIKLKDGDNIVSSFPINDEEIVIVTKKGRVLAINSTEVNSTGRATSGVKAIKLDSDDEVVFSDYIKKNATKKVIYTVTKNGLIKATLLEDIPLSNRGNKGGYIQKLKEKDEVVDGLLYKINASEDITIQSTDSSIKIPLKEISVTSTAAQGVVGMKLRDGEFLRKIVKNYS